VAETPFLHFLLGFRAHFDEVVLISRVFDEMPEGLHPYPVPEEGVRVVPLPPYPRIADLYKPPFKYKKKITEALNSALPDLDALWLNFGHPVSLQALKMASNYSGLKCFAVQRGAYERDARLRTGGPPGLGFIAGKVMQRNMKKFAKMAQAQRRPCFAYGEELVHRLQDWDLEVHSFIDSLLTEAHLKEAPKMDAVLGTDLLFVGRLTPEKGLDILLESLSEAHLPTGGTPSLRVVGSGPEEARLKALVSELSIEKSVIFDGHISHGPELFSRYENARVLVMPSRTEGVPKTAYEAMAFGCPVVAAAVGGLPEIVGHANERGCLVAPEDPYSLMDALNVLLSEEALMAQMSENARLFARHVTLEGQVQQMVNLAGLSD
jgi:glycosyltransferase involved in cell wall biosynthesis